MGVWGTTVTDDDFAQDIIGEYLERYDKGEEPKQIRAALETGNVDGMNHPQEGHLFWLALAKAQWEIGALDKDVLQRVEQIVESDVGTKVWIELGGGNPDKRRESIKAFAQKIQIPRAKPRKRKKQIPRSSPFEVGDVLTFQTSNGDYGVAVVGVAEKQTRFGLTGIVNTDVYQKNKPTLNDVFDANVVVLKDAYKGEEKIQTCMYYAEPRKKEYEPFEVIGRVKVRNLLKPFDFYSSYTAFGNLIGSYEGGIKRKLDRKITLKKFLGYYPFQKISIL